MGGSVNLQGGGQYQMPGAGYAGMQGSVNAPQTPDQYAASQAAMQPQQTGARGPISFNPFTGEPDYSYDPGISTQQSNPWTGQAAPVQSPYFAYGNQTAPMMTASQATAYAPMNLPGMQFARPSFYYPSISNQMAYMGGLGGYGGYGGYGTSMGGKGMQTSPMMGGMGYGGYMGMPGYFSGLGAMGSYMPMMQRSYPSYSNPYPALAAPAQYQPQNPPRSTATGTSTGGKGMQMAQQAPATPPAPTYNPALSPVAPPPGGQTSPFKQELEPGMYDNLGDNPPPIVTTNKPEAPVQRPTGPTLTSSTDTGTLEAPPFKPVDESGLAPALTASEEAYAKYANDPDVMASAARGAAPAGSPTTITNPTPGQFYPGSGGRTYWEPSWNGGQGAWVDIPKTKEAWLEWDKQTGGGEYEGGRSPMNFANPFRSNPNGTMNPVGSEYNPNAYANWIDDPAEQQRTWFDFIPNITPEMKEKILASARAGMGTALAGQANQSNSP